MTFALLAYFTIAFGVLAALARMILVIGKGMGQCPQTAPVARAGAISIATGFLAIGTGGVLLIGALVPSLSGGQAVLMGTLACAGLVSLTLGLGFSHALRVLRALVQGRPAHKDPLPVPMEPVLP